MKELHDFRSAKTSKPILIRRAIGGGSALLGLCWIGMVLYPILQGFWHERELYYFLFMLMIIPMMSLPGAIAALFGVRLFRSMSLNSLKWVIGVFFAFGVFWVSARLLVFFPGILPEHIALSGLLFLLGLTALPVYRAALQFILPHLDPDNSSSSPVIGKVALLLLAFLLWSLLSDTIREYRPIKEGYAHVPELPWVLIGLFLPLIAAYAFYRIAAALLLRSNAHQTAGGDA